MNCESALCSCGRNNVNERARKSFCCVCRGGHEDERGSEDAGHRGLDGFSHYVHQGVGGKRVEDFECGRDSVGRRGRRRPHAARNPPIECGRWCAECGRTRARNGGSGCCRGGKRGRAGCGTPRSFRCVPPPSTPPPPASGGDTVVDTGRARKTPREPAPNGDVSAVSPIPPPISILPARRRSAGCL